MKNDKIAEAEKPSILVVDDNEGICETMADILGEMNYTVHTATDGYKALDLVKTHEYTMTLMDVRMPGLDGFETLKRVRQMRPSMKVVMITAYAHDETVEKIRKMGVDAILTKPINFTELVGYLP